MTQTLEPIQSEDVERLELLISLSQHSVLVFCLYRSPEDIRNVQNLLSQRLNIPIQYQTLNAKQLNPIRLVRDLPDQPRQVMFAVYEGNLDDELTTCAKYANIQRDALSQVEHPLVMWFREEAFVRFIRQAPDFWAWHSAVLEFQSPSPPNIREAVIELETREPELSAVEREKIVAQVASYEELLRAYTSPTDEDLPYLGRTYGRLGSLLGQVGEYKKALEYGEKAVNILRKLANEKPDVFLSDLASSLNNLGIHYGNLGRLENALKASEESVQIRRKLAEIQPETYSPDLAASLNNLGNRYSSLNRFEEALKVTKESVQIRRKLAETQPSKYSSDFAGSLNNLGNRYGNLDRLEEALKVSEESTKIYQELANIQPDTYLPQLAMSFNNLGAFYGRLGRIEDGIKASREAYEIYQKLAKAQPNVYLPNLAGSLNNLGVSYRSLGRLEEALNVFIESLNIIKPLFKTYPTAFTRDIMQQLQSYFRILQELEQQPDPELLRGFEPILETLNIKI